MCPAYPPKGRSFTSVVLLCLAQLPPRYAGCLWAGRRFDVRWVNIVKIDVLSRRQRGERADAVAAWPALQGLAQARVPGHRPR